MTTTTQLFVLRALALALAGALLLTDRVVPEWLWGGVVALSALTVKRPGDTSPTELARVLESVDPTTYGGPTSDPADESRPAPASTETDPSPTSTPDASPPEA